MATNRKRLLTISAIVLVAVAIGLAITYRYKGGTRTKSAKLTFALPVADWWTAAPFITSQSSSFFKQRGLELTTLEVKSGLESKNAVAAGTADVGLSAATPLALAAAKKEGLVVLGTYLRSSAMVGLIRPRDMQSKSVPPQPIAIVPSTISESYLYRYLSSVGERERKMMEQKQLQTLTVRPADIPGSLKNGSAKSAIIWEPFLSLGAEQSGLQADPTAVDFEVNLYLITRPSVLQERPEEIRAFLNAVDDSCRYLRENSDGARHQVERRFDFRVGFLAAAWPKVQYGVSFERPRMEDEIKREADTARALGYITEIPDTGYMFPATPPH